MATQPNINELVDFNLIFTPEADEKVKTDKQMKIENDQIAERITKHKEKITAETEQISQELGHGTNPLNRFNEPILQHPINGEKETRLEEEKREGHERWSNRTEEDPLVILRTEVEQSRQMYAAVEYNNRSALARVRKELSSKNNEDSFEVRDARDQYNKKLTRLKNAEIEHLKARGLSGEELQKEMRELVVKYGSQEAIELFNARTDAKADKLSAGSAFKKCWGFFEKVTNKYNKLPIAAKLGISAAVFASGLGMVIAGKRILGGIVAGVGTAKGLDALHQRGMKKEANMSADELLKAMQESGQETPANFEKLSKLLDSKIDQIDNQLIDQKWASMRNKAIGIGVGVFLGSGWASKAMGAGFGKVKEFFPGAHAATAGLETSTPTPLTDSMEHPYDMHMANPANAGNVTYEALHTSAAVEHLHPETLEVKGQIINGHFKSSSIWQVYLKALKEARPDLSKAELNEMARVGVSDAAKQFGIEHHMTKPGEAMAHLSKIHGATLHVSYDSHGTPHIQSIDHVKFMHGAGHHAKHVLKGVAEKHLDVPSGNTPPVPNEVPVAAVSDSELTPDVDQHAQAIDYEMKGFKTYEGVLNGEIAAEEAQLPGSLEVVHSNAGFIGDSGYGRVDKDIVTHLHEHRDQLTKGQRELLKLGQHYKILNNPEFKHNAADLRRHIFNDNGTLYKGLRLVKMDEVGKPGFAQNEFLEKIPDRNGARQSVKSLLKVYKPLNGETVEKWTFRMADDYQKGISVNE